jgi:hypothetical protein
MNHHQTMALTALGSALVLGILGDALLRATPWGLNVGLWVLSLLAAAALVWRASGQPLSREALALALAAFCFATSFAGRDSPTLRALSGLGLLGTLGLLAWRSRGGRLWESGLVHCARGLLESGGLTAVGLPHLVARDVAWPVPAQHTLLRSAPGVAIGVALTIPLLALFGGLFMAADAAYRRLVVELLHIDLAAWIPHLFTLGVTAWIAGGYLRALWWPVAPPVVGRARAAFHLGSIELGVMLALLDLLFLSFVLVQCRYLFGGADLVEITPGVTYAEYARQGFFELVAVTLLVLPLLLLSDWLREPGVNPRVFRGLAWAMIGLLFVVMASALYRMRLYQREFGLTELRFYTTAFMLYLAVLLVWLGATVLRGRRQRFTGGALAAGCLAVAALHAVNPDGWIVRVNATFAAETGRPFDAAYVRRLSADAVPALIEALSQLPPTEREEVRHHVSRYAQDGGDWRTWTWSRAQARQQVAALNP